jgi:hypothetical protein
MNDRVPGPHWQLGITYKPLCPQPGVTFDVCIAESQQGEIPEENPDKEATVEHEVRGATPFTVYVRKDCAPVGFWGEEDDEINRSLTATEAWQVERTFFNGDTGVDGVVNFPHLASDTEVLDGEGNLLQSAATILSMESLPIVEALGALEAHLGNCYHGVGTIHAPAALGAHLASENLLERRAQRYRTHNGNFVSLARGYTGEAPDNTLSSDTVWMYATGATFFLRSEIRDITGSDALDLDKNTLEALGERRYVVGWDCCHFAVPVAATGVGS